MGADYIVHRDCAVKQELGQGDVIAGTLGLLQMLKSRERAAAILKLAMDEGNPDPYSASVTVMVLTQDGAQPREVSVRQMAAEAAPLESLSSHCQTCDACAMGELFGCSGYLNYPITASLEQWILSRLQPAETLASKLMFRAIDDFGYDGQAMAAWRQRRELMERSAPLETTVGDERISADQLLQAILACGSELNPDHCSMLLHWLGALKPAQGNADEALALSLATPPEQRRQAFALDVGPPDEDASIRGLQQLLFAMYVAWTLDLPLLMDS
jgi:hypothetical protein